MRLLKSYLKVSVHCSTDNGHYQMLKLMVINAVLHSAGTQHNRKTHPAPWNTRAQGTAHQILEPQNGTIAVFTKNFKHLVVTSVGRNM
jgi:hypothetical protein